MHIVIVYSSLRLGGAERVLSTLANAWAENGYTVTMLLYTNKTETSFFSIDPKIAVKHLDCLEVSNNFFQFVQHFFKKFNRIRKYIKALKPEVIVSFATETNILVILATRLLSGFHLIVSERSNPLKYPNNNFYKKLRNLLYPLADRVVLQTEDSKICFPNFKNLTVIPNPIKKFEMDIKFKLNLKKPFMVAVGRLTEEKGFEDIILAFAKIIERYPNWSLVFVGDGPKYHFLMEQRRLLHLEKNIHFVGVCEHPENVMQHAEFIVLSSRFEGFPNALCEALALGLPGIAYDCQFGPRAIIQDQVNGLLVPANDITKLSHAMITLMEDAKLREQYGKNAKKMSERLSLEQILSQWESLFQLNSNENRISNSIA